MERTATDRVHDPVIGRLLDGRYLVGERIARGGMATVYEATDSRLDRPVAIKVMHPGLVDGSGDNLSDDASFSRRFRREAQAAARLAHENVVAVFDQGDDDGVLFLVMERVIGITLRDLIRLEAPIPPIKTMAVIEPVLAALASAHRAGMIHRDVKPENVLLSDDGRVKVADFGLARAVNAETQHTTAGVLIGTVSYLAPELVVAGDADARADVYAAGVLLYEMLTGDKPHRADTAVQVAYKHVHEDIPPPSRVVPALPAYVDALVARATARDVERRPVDAGVLLSLVRRVRATLEAGVTDDADLVADLLPGSGRHGSTGSARDPFHDTDDQMPSVIIDPSQDTGAWSPVPDLDEPNDSAPEPPRVARHAAVLPPDFVDERSRSAAVPAPRRRSDEETYTDAYERSYDRSYAGSSVGAGYADEAYADEDDFAPTGGYGDRQRGTGRRRTAVRRRRAAVLLILALATALVVGIGAWYFGVARYTVTPAVINLKQAAAKTRVEQAGLDFTVSRTVYSERIAAGAVLSTSPQPGSKILKSGTVTAVISRGPERHAVPAVKGKSLDEAQAALQDARLSFGKAISSYDEKVPKGQVLSTSPAIGSELRRNTAVDVVVSKGRKPIPVPDETGKGADAAAQALQGLGLTVSRSEAHSDTVDKGVVISQKPSSGTLYRGGKVALVVSSGPVLVKVPKVESLSLEDARTLLESKGFEVETKKSKRYVGLRYVLTSNPKQGESVPKGSTVTLLLV